MPALRFRTSSKSTLKARRPRTRADCHQTAILGLTVACSRQRSMQLVESKGLSVSVERGLNRVGGLNAR